MDAVLHVTNGDSTAETLRRTSLGGATLPWRDALHAGPVPADPRHELLRRRAAFLSGRGWGDHDAILASFEERDRRIAQAFADDEPVVLWFEHDLYDQLQLLDILALAHEARVSPEAIVVGTFPGKPSFRGLGELSAEELETLWPGRREVPAESLRTANAVWTEIRRETPEGLARRAEQDEPGLPFVRGALLRLLEELPAPDDGLSSTERTALQAISEGARSPAAAFESAQQLEPTPFLGDTWFYVALAALGRGPNRLLATADGEQLPEPVLGTERRFAELPLQLTAAGERVLEGKADRVELLGIDRWVGGTHVTTDAVWRWDAASRRLLAP
jgi:uncharacterized protein DUF1835